MTTDLVQADPKYSHVVEMLAARVKAAGETGPPWAWPLTGAVASAVQNENCEAANKTGFYEPQHDRLPPPMPPSRPLGPPYQYWQNGKCLTVRNAHTPGPMTLMVEA